MKFKRIYNLNDEDASYFKILIDGFWPRGIKKETIDLWIRNLAPSYELIKWYSHSQEKCNEFRKMYIEELKEKREEIEKLIEMSRSKKIVLLYASKGKCTNADVLMEFIKDSYGPEYLE